MIEAVTFDYWQTLVSERPGEIGDAQRGRFGSTLVESGLAVTDDALTEAFGANWARFERHWSENLGPYTATDSVAFISRHLGIEPAEDVRERLVDGFRVVGEKVHLDVAPGIDECLGSLRAAGVGLGIVCDVGLTSSPTLRRRLDGFGLLDSFDAWAFSDETGWFKPAREAFAPALDGLGVDDPTRVAHVGDNRRTDVAGARALGMIAVRYTGLRAASSFRDSHGGEGPEGDLVLDDHRQLPAALGVG